MPNPDKIDISAFIELAHNHPVLDVRSPAEYAHAHFPGAYNLPLFNNDERKEVGTAYKQESREKAIKIGLDFFGPKMRKVVEDAEKIAAENNNSKTLLVHCWRGGMRSAAIAWLLNLYGFKIYTLAGGYKNFRAWVLAQFSLPYSFHILGGYTGSGKTLLLQEIKKSNWPIIDLEALAIHKGSAFGDNPEVPQPSQEMFENNLAMALYEQNKNNKSIWLEDESQRIGNVSIPPPLWYCMRNAPVWFLNIPFQSRLNYILKDYGKLERNKIADSIIRIKKRLGGLETKNAMNFLIEDKLQDCFAILLRYYDKAYHNSLYNRSEAEKLITEIVCSDNTTKTNFIHLKNALQAIHK